MAATNIASDEFDLEVADIRDEATLVRSFLFRPAGGAPLPGFEPGAHVGVRPDGAPGHRFYSLINTVPGPDATRAPGAYHVAVRRDDRGAGGSRAMHGLRPGDRVRVTRPRNDFPLLPGSGPVLLLAGGIGITPLLSMAAALRGSGRPFRAAYAGRSRAHLAFADALRALTGEAALALHCDDEAGGRPLDVPGLLAGADADATVYVCGPAPMIDAALAAGAARGWGADRVRFERFAVPAPAPATSGDAAFVVELRRSGRVLAVPPDRTILDVLLEAGEDPLHDCRRGDCGICQCAVLEGEPDHRDFVLTEAEREANALIQICVSRSRSPKLVLDL